MTRKDIFLAHSKMIIAELDKISAQDVPRNVTDAIAEIGDYLAAIGAQNDSWWCLHGEGVTEIMVAGPAQGLPGLSADLLLWLMGFVPMEWSDIQRNLGQCR